MNKLTKKVEAPTASCLITLYLEGEVILATPAPTITNVMGAPPAAAVTEANRLVLIFIGLKPIYAKGIFGALANTWAYMCKPLPPTIDESALAQMVRDGWVKE
jgi:hypothetical protein